jgi:hypothetical protein
MEKELVLKDSVDISDSKIRGIVVIEKEDGTILFRKENMIVATGRQYLRNLVYGLITSPAETRKINSIRFGTGLNLVKSSDTNLTSVISAYDISLTTLQWKKIPLEDQTGYDEGVEFPSNPTENDLFLNTYNGNFYIYTKAMTVSNSISSSEIGLKISVNLRGQSGFTADITELGLFLNDTPTATMFSRLVFDKIPLTQNMEAYNLTYYIYF